MGHCRHCESDDSPVHYSMLISVFGLCLLKSVYLFPTMFWNSQMCPGLRTTIVRIKYGSKDRLPWGMDVVGTDLRLVIPDLPAHEPTKRRLLRDARCIPS